jgi:UDP-N-acetylglucosamine 2-epimerase (hydrolysing)
LKKNKKIIFLTGTRADFGKLKPLMDKIDKSRFFNCHVFVTGMHMLTKYGSTYREVQKQEYKNTFLFRNQKYETKQDIILSNTITGFSRFVKKINPDLIVVHGDRIEALAGAIVGALNHILVAHIEGGEISGTIDESIRHSVTKLAHIHFVANNEAKKRLTQLGERKNSIFIIGSPDIEVMKTGNLPSFKHVKKYYNLPFEKFAILIFHPVSSELDKLKNQVNQIVDALINSKDNFIVIYPNNDEGSDVILNELKRIKKNSRFKLYPSLRFQYFLSIMKNSKYIIGNSSAGVREAEVYGIPTIDIGSRQKNRYKNKDIIHVEPNKTKIQAAIKNIKNKKLKNKNSFGNVVNSSGKFYKILKSNDIWKISHQKEFIDLN